MEGAVEEQYEEYEDEFEEIEVEEEVEEDEEGGEGEGVGASGGGGFGGGGAQERGIDKVDRSDREAKLSGDGSSSSEGKIFVGGVAWETTEEDFARHFTKYGEIIDSVIMKDKHTRKPRGFGFITFADPSVIDKVLKDEHVIDGRTVEVKRTVPRETMASKGGVLKTKKIFVGGIPTSLTDDEFKEYFASYGKVVEHQIMLDHSTGRSRGFGFITFESEEAVEEIMADGKVHELGGKQVELKKAVPKKAGGDSGGHPRAARGGGGGGNMYGAYGGSGFGYGQSAGAYGGTGRAAVGGYGRGYGYGAAYGYGMGFGAGYGAPMYGYGAGAGYGGQGGYGAFYGAGDYTGGGSYGGGRYGSRYHPYGR